MLMAIVVVLAVLINSSSGKRVLVFLLGRVAAVILIGEVVEKLQ
jgi:hypothetical protein